jgi:hypothetical protein
MAKAPQTARMEDDAETSMSAYYRRVVARAWCETRAAVGRHLLVTAAVLVVTYGLGFVVGERLRVATLIGVFLIPLAAVGVVGLATFGAQVLSAPVRRAREAARDAAEKAEALETRIPNLATGPFVETKHEDTLRAMLGGDRTALEHEHHRPDREPLDREMFAAHFGDLDARLAEWDGVVARNSLAPVKLRERFLDELSQLELELPYELGALAIGLVSITSKRALSETLSNEIPPALDAPDQLWGAAWTDDPVRYGQVEFNQRATGVSGRVVELSIIDMTSDLSGDDFHAQVARSLTLVRTLLIDAQAWPEAHEILSARESFLAFPRTELLEDAKRAQLKPKIVVAVGCPGCE